MTPPPASPLLDRLRRAGLRPTAARLGILQVFAAAPQEALCAEEVFRRALRQGAPGSLGTVYRTVYQLEARGLLLGETAADGMARYRLTPEGPAACPPLRLRCPSSGRLLELADSPLKERLIAVARREGVDLRGMALVIAPVDEAPGLAR